MLSRPVIFSIMYVWQCAVFVWHIIYNWKYYAERHLSTTYLCFSDFFWKRLAFFEPVFWPTFYHQTVIIISWNIHILQIVSFVTLYSGIIFTKNGWNPPQEVFYIWLYHFSLQFILYKISSRNTIIWSWYDNIHTLVCTLQEYE